MISYLVVLQHLDVKLFILLDCRRVERGVALTVETLVFDVFVEVKVDRASALHFRGQRARSRQFARVLFQGVLIPFFEEFQ